MAAGGLLLAQQERLLEVPQLLLLEQLVAALPVRRSPAYRDLWQQVRVVWCIMVSSCCCWCGSAVVFF